MVSIKPNTHGLGDTICGNSFSHYSSKLAKEPVGGIAGVLDTITGIVLIPHGRNALPLRVKHGFALYEKMRTASRALRSCSFAAAMTSSVASAGRKCKAFAAALTLALRDDNVMTVFILITSLSSTSLAKKPLKQGLFDKRESSVVMGAYHVQRQHIQHRRRQGKRTIL
jgi:hypothetical protein